MSLAAAATIASIGSAVVGGIGAIQSSNAASAAAGYNAEVAANNAKIATQNAQYAGAEGEQNVAAEAAKTRARVGATVAAQGASGIDVNTGSSVDTRESEAKIGMLNALNIRSEAARKAYGYETQSSAFTGQAALDKSQQQSDKTAGLITAGTTVLGGVGNAYLNYGKFLSNNDPTGGITGGGGAYTDNYANSFAPVDYPA